MCEGCLRIKDDCLRVHPRSSTRVRCYTMCISRMPIGTPGKFVGTRRRRGSRLRGGARWDVWERWCPDDIWKRHRQTYREEARMALPGRASRFVAFVFTSWRPIPSLLLHLRAYHPDRKSRPSGVDSINASVGWQVG